MADAVGVNILITGISASGAVAAGMAGKGAIAVAVAAAIGVISDALYLRGTASWAVLVIYGIGLVAIAGAGHHAAEHAS
jgi:hypothetical protein